MSATATPIPLPKRVNDLRGHVFGRWTVLEYLGKAKNSRHALWRVRCSCPKQTEKKLEGYVLTRGTTLSCGCYRDERVREANTTHGKSRTPEYEAWHTGQQRTTNPNHPRYADYGGRGITWPAEWLGKPDQFLKDMGEKPNPTDELERVDNNLGYSKANCIWASPTVQGRNKRNNRVITHDGQSLTLSTWAEKTGICARTIVTRLDVLGWTVEEALTTPARYKSKPVASP